MSKISVDPTPDTTGAGDGDLLPAVVAAVQAAGADLLTRFEPTTNLLTVSGIAEAIRGRDQDSLRVMRPRLEQVLPGAGWVEDELDDGPLPDGPWWVTDPVEGAINYVHGLGEWAVTATLVRDNAPVLTVVHLPVQDATYTAVHGAGSYCNGRRLHVSAKKELSAALVGTGQASPRESGETFRLIGRTLTAMMQAAGVSRVSVPATLQLIQVAAGRMDVFWQHSAVRSGLLAGALLVAEAGGTVTDLRGDPWSLHSSDFLAAAPGLHTAASRTLTAAV